MQASRFTQAARPQGFDCRDQNLLRKVARSVFIPHVT
jgi:hypothetical protein